MVQEAIAEPSSKKVHPFFAKGSSNDASSTTSVSECPSPAPVNQDTSLESGGSEGRIAKRRKTDTPPSKDDSEGNIKRARRKDTASLDGLMLSHLIKAPDAPSPRPPTSTAGAGQNESTAGAAPRDLPTNHTKATDSLASAEKLKPTKVLKFNLKTGTLGSPPRPKKKQLLVTIKYGKDEESQKRIGHEITQILDGRLQIPVTPTKSKVQRSRRAVKVEGTNGETNQTTHPLFRSKAKTSAADQNTTQKKNEPKRRHSIFMSTPVSPRKSRASADFDPSKVPQFGFKNNGTKIPGSAHPLWPAQGMSHVRGFDMSREASSSSRAWTTRKSKGNTTAIQQSESILVQFLNNLDLHAVRKDLPRDPDSFMPVPSELRLPPRHFESGRRLQQRVLSQLRTRRPPPERDVDSSSDEQAENQKVHCAISRLFSSLGSHLSAYDKSSCESSCWAHKYAPTSATQVVQAGKEAFLLRDWLVALKVQSVDTGSSDNKKADLIPKKRRKKAKLADFVVDSSDEDELDEIPDDESEWTAGSRGIAKTVVRGGGMNPRGQAKVANALMISGPHGCGKTAAVYAVAKELDFEVFEINSSSRRSGKDLLEKVGDMTRNHLVQQHRVKEATSEQAEEDKTAEDIKSGKQGTMMTFFQPKPGANTKPAKTTTKQQRQDGTEPGQRTMASKNQKQSLILLEEVDVLYEEDKQFWATLMTMISQSRRPFIMTCNDESLVPVQSLSLQGIFRFTPPPQDLAVDLCLLVAANEGHVLKRPAVDALYDARNQDLRAVLHELNYWCQIGIGDRRGGFDWFVLRWPRGVDLDDRGDTIRVISEDTYLKGMGWISRDPIAAQNVPPLAKEVEIMHQARDQWQLDIGAWEDSLDMEAWAESAAGSDAASKRAAMSAYESFCMTLSDSDMCSDGAFASSTTERLDATLPDFSSKARSDYTLGRGLLEAEPITRQFSSSADIAITMRSKTRQTLLGSLRTTPSRDAAPFEPINETRAISILNNKSLEINSHLGRYDMAQAFDPIAVAPTSTATMHLDPSVFDRTLKLITLDVAPYVRSIVAYDHRLMTERVKLSNLLSQGGKRKRMRTTRSAYSALEGGERKTTRRERYFGDVLNTGLVLRTGGDWQQAVRSEQHRSVPVDGERSTIASSGDTTESDASHESCDDLAS